MNSATGVTVGAVVGGLLAFLLTRTFLKKVDIGVVGAAAGAGALIGGAIVAPAPKAD